MIPDKKTNILQVKLQICFVLLEWENAKFSWAPESDNTHNLFCGSVSSSTSSERSYENQMEGVF